MSFSLNSITFAVLGGLGLINCTLHSFIMVFLVYVPALRQKKSNQLLININIGHAVNGFIVFLMIFSKANALTYISYAFSAHGNTSLVFLTIDRAILIRWPFRYQTLPFWIQILFLMASPSAAISSILIGS